MTPARNSGDGPRESPSSVRPNSVMIISSFTLIPP
jgi:hypothetical protein